MQNTAVKELNFYQYKITEIAQFTVTPHRALQLRTANLFV